MDNLLEISDEEFNKLPSDAAEAPTEPVEEQEEVQEGEDTGEVTEEPVEASEEPTEDSSTTEEEESAKIDYEQEYKKLLTPFKANGKMIQLNTVEDAITLMQQGANYNKKMAALKPNLKIVKMLENNGLLDESKLSFLIDLEKKNPEAVRKYLKDSGIDPLDLDVSSDVSYQPRAYTVNDKEIELDSVLEDIKETESFTKTIDVIGNKWDTASKKVLLDSPQVIKIINDHVASGIYDQITQVVERERMLGRLTELSDIEAYKYVGDAINARGGFRPFQQQIASTAQATNTKVDSSIKDRKKAASSTKSVSSSPKNMDFNPLSMSDEEFEKIANSKYM